MKRSYLLLLLFILTGCNETYLLVKRPGAVANGGEVNPPENLGRVTTLAGVADVSGSADGLGAAAGFYIPLAVALDSAGTLYVSDAFNHTIRKVSPDGNVTTFAGSPGVIGTTDANGSLARFNKPAGLVFDNLGNLYVADNDSHTIRKITPAGDVTTIAGTAGVSGSADGTGTAASFNLPTWLAIDNAQNIYVTDLGNQTIRKITPGGVVTTFAGTTGVRGSANGIRTAAEFNDPYTLTFDRAENLFVAEFNGHTIRKITPSGNVTTFAGKSGVAGDANGLGTAAEFNTPAGMAIDHSDNIYLVEYGGQLVRKITPSGMVTTFAGQSGVMGNADGTGTAAQFKIPHGIAISKTTGIMYVADGLNHTIRKIE